MSRARPRSSGSARLRSETRPHQPLPSTLATPSTLVSVTGLCGALVTGAVCCGAALASCNGSDYAWERSRVCRLAQVTVLVRAGLWHALLTPLGRTHAESFASSHAGWPAEEDRYSLRTVALKTLLAAAAWWPWSRSSWRNDPVQISLMVNSIVSRPGVC